MDIGSMVEWVNDNSGFTVAIVTSVYTIVTLAIVVEARRARLWAGEATVLYRASPWPKSHLHLAVRLENYGPAVARDVSFKYWLSRNGDLVPGSEKSLRESLLPTGLPREALPMDPAAHGPQTLEELAAAGFTLNAEWSWKDVCRRRHKGHDSREIRQIVADYRESRVLIEHFPLDSLPKIEEHLDKISDTLADIAKAANAVGRGH